MKEDHGYFVNKLFFGILIKAMGNSRIRLVETPLWLKVEPCPPDCDKKDHVHVVGATLGGIFQSKFEGEFCRLRIRVDVQKPL